jgi:L-asparagine permease
MDLAGIGIAGTWAMILISHLAFLRKVKRGEEQRPEFRMPGAPYTNYLALLFFAVVVASNVTSESGRWTLALFAVVVVLMVAGWYYVRGRVGNLTDEAAASLQGEETLVAGD